MTENAPPAGNASGRKKPIPAAILLWTGFIALFSAGLFLLLSIAAGWNLLAREAFARNGSIDLSAMDLKHGSFVALDGEWGFFPGELIDPSNLPSGIEAPTLSRVPGPWKRTQGGLLGSIGSGTYRLSVLLPADIAGTPMVLRFSSVLCAFRAWVDGRQIIEFGRPSRNDRVFSGAIGPAQAEFTPSSPSITIIVEVSNRAFSMAGGIDGSVILGMAPVVAAREKLVILYTGFVSGLFLLMGCYHLILARFRNGEAYHAYFGILCLLMIIQTLCSGEKIILILAPGLDISIFYRMWYLVFAAFPVYISVFRGLFPSEIPRILDRAASAVFYPWAGLGLVLPLRTYTAVSPWFYALGTGLLLALIGFNLLAIAKKRRQALPMLLATILPTLAAINDSLYAMRIVPTGMIMHILFPGAMIFLSILISNHREEEPRAETA